MPMSSQHRRRRPHKPYTAATAWRKAIWSVVDWARISGVKLHGARVQKLLLALGKRQPEVKSGIVYAGTEQLGKLGGQSGRSVQRAIPEIEALAVLELTRPHPCDGTCRQAQRRSGARKGVCPGHGGRTLDEQGKPVNAANGFTMRTDWLQELSRAKQRRGGAPPPAPPAAGAVPPGESTWERGMRMHRERQLAQGPSP